MNILCLENFLDSENDLWEPFIFFLLVNFLIQKISKRIVHNMGTRCLNKYFSPLNSMYH